MNVLALPSVPGKVSVLVASGHLLHLRHRPGARESDSVVLALRRAAWLHHGSRPTGHSGAGELHTSSWRSPFSAIEQNKRHHGGRRAVDDDKVSSAELTHPAAAENLAVIVRPTAALITTAICDQQTGQRVNPHWASLASVLTCSAGSVFVKQLGWETLGLRSPSSVMACTGSPAVPA